MARDLFGNVVDYLGVKGVGGDELKRLTNVLKEKKLLYNAGDVIVSEGEKMPFCLGHTKGDSLFTYATLVFLNHRKTPSAFYRGVRLDIPYLDEVVCLMR